MSDYYILDDKGQPVPADLVVWARWFEDAIGKDSRRVAVDDVNGARISTVFLGLDHSFGGGPPLLFETMIFGGEHDQWQDRCSTRDEALQMHERAKALVMGMAH